MRRIISALFLLLALIQPAAAQLKDGDYVAIVGDSITEQRLYSLYMECYLVMCQPAGKLEATQFGWGGETAPGFANRMANDMLRFNATVATTCFGMNDGGYSPLDEGKAKRYRDGQRSVVQQMKKAGVRFIVVGSPGAVDFDAFRRNPQDPQAARKASEMYNKTLTGLRDIAREVAKEEGVAFASVIDPMLDAMTKAKAKYGPAYHVCGGDGFHPDQNGHLVMAYAFLKGLGCDGNLGSITVDLGADKAEAAGGHKVLSAKAGEVEIESTRYPFCFTGDPKSPSATRGIIEFFPFNEDLNRLTLVVKNAGADKVKVTWGAASKEFAAADLAKGVNLAAEFLDNPFSAPFAKVQGVIAQKQGMEVGLIKQQLHNLPSYLSVVPQEKESLERIATALVAKDKASRADVSAAVTPVKHVIKVEAVK